MMLAHYLLDLINRVFEHDSIEDTIDLFIIFSISKWNRGVIWIQCPKTIILSCIQPLLFLELHSLLCKGRLSSIRQILITILYPFFLNSIFPKHLFYLIIWKSNSLYKHSYPIFDKLCAALWNNQSRLICLIQLYFSDIVIR